MDLRPTPPDAAFPDKVPVPRGAAEQLRRMIEERHLRPGDRLPSQRELSERLKISRASLREALTALETLGLVSVQPGRGVFVAAGPAGPAAWRFADRGTPRDAYEVRHCVEGFAAGIAATRLDADGLTSLKGSVAALREAFLRRDVDAMALADSAFHDLIIAVCGNPILAAMYRSVREMMVESQKLPMQDPSGLENTVLEHEELLVLFERRDAIGASDGMKRHICAAAARYGLDLRPFEASAR